MSLSAKLHFYPTHVCIDKNELPFIDLNFLQLASFSLSHFNTFIYAFNLLK